MSCGLLSTNSGCWRTRWLMSPPVQCSINLLAEEEFSGVQGKALQPLDGVCSTSPTPRLIPVTLDALQTKQPPRILSRHRVDVRIGESGLGVETQWIRIGDGKGIIGSQQQTITPHHRAQELQRRRMVHNGVVVKSLQVR